MDKHLPHLPDGVDEAALVQAVTRGDSRPYGHDRQAMVHLAAAQNYLRLMTTLIAGGADVDARLEGQTPLHRAVREGHNAMVDILLQAGADVGARLESTLQKDMSALHLAVFYGDAAMLGQLLAAADAAALTATTHVQTAYDDVLRLVLLAEKPAMLDVLRRQGVFFHRQGPDGMTPAQYLILHKRSAGDSFDLLKMLAEGGADLHARTNGGETLLMLAARTGWPQAFEYLLAQGVATDGAANDGQTLLHAAAAGPRIEIFRAVMALQPDLNARTRHGETAFFLAARRNRLAHVELLAAAGADPHIADIKGRTPDMVCQGRPQAMTRYAVIRAQRAQTPTNGARKGPRGRKLPPRRLRKQSFKSSKRR